MNNVSSLSSVLNREDVIRGKLSLVKLLSRLKLLDGPINCGFHLCSTIWITFVCYNKLTAHDSTSNIRKPWLHYNKYLLSRLTTSLDKFSIELADPFSSDWKVFSSFQSSPVRRLLHSIIPIQPSGIERWTCADIIFARATRDRRKKEKKEFWNFIQSRSVDGDRLNMWNGVFYDIYCEVLSSRPMRSRLPVQTKF